MLTTVNTLKGYTLDSLDGDIGKVEEFYFDDRRWAIRYLVADTGTWLTGRQVLISPYALGIAAGSQERIGVSLTKKQIEGSPPLSSAVPVSRHFEESYYGYYGWPMYWGGPYMWGPYPFLMREPDKLNDSKRGESSWDAHLRSTRDVTGHHIQAEDGGIGHVEDFIVDDETWAIRYLVVNTHNWWPGRKVLVAPQWIDHVSWSEEKVFVNLLRDTIRNSPEYKAEQLLTREYEAGLHRHYDRQGYWVDEAAVHVQAR